MQEPSCRLRTPKPSRVGSKFADFLKSVGLMEVKVDSLAYHFAFITPSGSPAGYINYMGNGLFNQKAVCKQDKGTCDCWIRSSLADADVLFRDIVVWLSEECSVDAHKQSAFELKLKYGMRPKPLKQSC